MSGEDVGENEWDVWVVSGGEWGGVLMSGIGVKLGTAARGFFASADLLSTARVALGNYCEVIVDEVVRCRYLDVDGVFCVSECVGDLLFKWEEGEIVRTRRFVEEFDAFERDLFNGVCELLCVVEVVSVCVCYGVNVVNVIVCYDFVDEYKKCGRVALRKFVFREFVAA